MLKGQLSDACAFVTCMEDLILSIIRPVVYFVLKKLVLSTIMYPYYEIWCIVWPIIKCGIIWDIYIYIYITSKVIRVAC